MKDYRDVIIRPIITEQTVANQDQNKYTFEVAKNTNKIEVRQAVEYLFGVKVEKVNILNVKPTTKRIQESCRNSGTWSGNRLLR
jgi:large subunit ribosomal protein L23